MPSPQTREQRRQLQDFQRAKKVEGTLSASSTKVLLIRHGETAWNAEHRLQGQQNPQLNLLGQQQAEAVASRLQEENFLGAVYSSDLNRAVKTAMTIALPLPRKNDGILVKEDPCFRERSLGVLEGLTVAEAQQQKPEAWSMLCSADVEERVPGGESLADVERRASEGLNKIASKHIGETILVVTHGGVLQALYRHACGREYSGKFKNCAINTLYIDGATWRTGVWGDVAHLEGVGVQKEAFGGGTGG